MAPPSSVANDPFISLEGEYNSGRLIWASCKRGSLNQKLPLQLSEDVNDVDGTISVTKVSAGFQRSTGIQIGCKLLMLQGRKVAEYQGGFEEIQRTLEENLDIEVVVLKEPIEDNEPSRCTTPKKAMRGPKLNDPGEEGWVKISPIPKSPTPPKTEVNDIPFIPRIWASNNRSSASSPVPFQLGQDEDGTVRIHKIQSTLRKKTRVRVGQQLVELQGRDITSYDSLEEIQAVVDEALELNFVVFSSIPEEFSTTSVKSQSKKKRSSVSSESEEPPASETTIQTEASSVMDSSSLPESESSTSSANDCPLPATTPTRKSTASWLKSKLTMRRNKRVSAV